jgi:hypothetical protein
MMVPSLLTTTQKPTPTPRTTVGNCSAENRFRMVYEQLAANLPRIDILMEAQSQIKS